MTYDLDQFEKDINEVETHVIEGIKRHSGNESPYAQACLKMFKSMQDHINIYRFESKKENDNV